MSSLPIPERIESIETRLRSVEEWMEGFKLQMTDVGNEVKANTRLTEETHGRTEEVYEFLRPARNFFRALGAIGNGAMRIGRVFMVAIEFLGRIAKPAFWIAAIGAASWAWWKTGTWAMPDWWAAFIR